MMFFDPLTYGVLLTHPKELFIPEFSCLKTKMIENCMVIGRLFVLWSAKEMCTKRGLSSYIWAKCYHFDD